MSESQSLLARPGARGATWDHGLQLGGRSHLVRTGRGVFRLGADVEAAYKPVAEAAQAEGRKHGAAKGGKTAGRGRPIASRGSSPKGKQDESARTTAVAALAVGMDRRGFLYRSRSRGHFRGFGDRRGRNPAARRSSFNWVIASRMASFSSRRCRCRICCRSWSSMTHQSLL